ncbi:hypothetical protein Tco_1255110 [Tanacetum coccineum]
MTTSSNNSKMHNDILAVGSKESLSMLATDDYTQSPKPHKTQAYLSRQTTSTRTHATTRNKGKKIVKPSLPQSGLASEEDNDEEQA